MKQIKRTRTGCLTCRSRKTKCDERKGTCGACERLGLDCAWQQLGPSRARPKQRTVEGRVACERCRIARAGCSKDRPTCERCFERQLTCVYDNFSPTFAEASSSAVPPWNTFELPHLIPQPTVDLLQRQRSFELFDAFSHQSHPFYASSFIHMASLQRALHENRAPRLLLLALSAVAARYMESSAQPGTECQAWAEEAKSIVMRNLNCYSTLRLGTLLLLWYFDELCCRHFSSWTLSGMAIRIAIGMGLHKDTGEDNVSHKWIEREVERRLMWSCFLVDRAANAGVPEYSMLPVKSLTLRLPSHSRNFELNIPEHTGTLGEAVRFTEVPLKAGLMTWTIWLVEIRCMIMSYTKNVQALPPWEDGSPFTDCMAQLNRWDRHLPDELRLTKDNLFARRSTGQDVKLLSLHLLYDQLRCDLYRLALPGLREALPATTLKSADPQWITDAQDKCYNHALAMCSSFASYNDLFPNERLGAAFLVEHMSQSIRIQIQYLEISRLDDTDLQSQISAQNFQFLLDLMSRMSQRFGYLAPMIKRLQRTLYRRGFADDPNEVSNAGASTPGPLVRSGHVLSRLHLLQGIRKYRDQEEDLPLPGEPSYDSASGTTEVTPIDDFLSFDNNQIPDLFAHVSDGTFSQPLLEDLQNAQWSKGPMAQYNPFLCNDESWSLAELIE